MFLIKKKLNIYPIFEWQLSATILSESFSRYAILA